MRAVLPFACVVSLATAGKEDDRVTRLPGYDAELPSKHYSGYLPVAQQSKMLHYYLQEADEAPESKPLMLWLNGGPGSSSLIGALTELGQLVFNRNSMAGAVNGTPAMFRNPHSWTTVANVLYIEAPAGVGFSYCVDPHSKCLNNDTSTAQDNYEALTGFIERFPEYAIRNKYLTGESYAGMYLPMLMQQIEQQAEVKNVKGLAIGNGCWGTVSGTNCGDYNDEPGLVYKSNADYLAGRGLVSTKQMAAADVACGDWSDPLSNACESAYDEILGSMGYFYYYDLDDDCPRNYTGNDRTSLRKRHHTSWQDRFARREAAVTARAQGLRAALEAIDSEDAVLGQVQMWCGGDAAAEDWKAIPAVQKALHVVGGKHKFQYEVERRDLAPLYRHFALERSDLNVLIYSGLSDDCVPFTGEVEHWVPTNTTTVEEWYPWTLNPKAKGSTVGHVRTYSDSFRFATVWGAGHMVPEYQPQKALAMIKQFLLVESSDALQV